MEVVGLIASVVSIIGMIVGYVIWLRRQKSPRGRLQQAIEEAFAKQEKTTRPDDLARLTSERRNRIKWMLETYRKVPPRK